jgi:hypothetical protein
MRFWGLPQKENSMCALSLDVSMSEELADIYGGVTVAIVRVTPEVAAEMLTRNTNNRPINKAHIKHFCEIMRRGEMIMNGETIILDADDGVLNGQHRLTACVQSGVPFDSLLVRGVDIEAFKTIDGGKKRSVADALSMQGEAHSTNLAAAAQAFVAFVDFGGVIRVSTSGATKVTPQMVDRVLRAHPGLRTSMLAMRKSKLYDNQYGYLLHYLFSTVSRRLAKDFADCLSGPHEDVSRPFVILRETLISQGHRVDLRQSRAAKAIKAFNAERSGARPKMLKFCSGEAFPTIDGLDYEALAESI